MKRKKMLQFLAAAAALICTLPAAASVYAATWNDANEFRALYPDVWTDPESGTVYRANWSLNGKQLFATDTAPYAEITFCVPEADAKQEDLLAVCKTVFDESYRIACSESAFSADHQPAVQVWAVSIQDAENRADTAEKADQLFEKLNPAYQLLDYFFKTDNESYRQLDSIEMLCTYDCDPADAEKLSALLAKAYPEWEMRAATPFRAEETYAVRKKGCAFYDVPAAEYLALRSDVKKQLGLSDRMILAVPEPEIVAGYVKNYILRKGDVTQNGAVNLLDAQQTLIAYTEQMAGNDTGLTDAQMQAADVNEDGKLGIEDAQYILVYYTENSVALNPITWEELLQFTPRTAKDGSIVVDGLIDYLNG